MSPDKYSNSYKSTGLTHLANAVRFSCQGLIAAFQRETAFRHELAVIIVATPAGIWIARSMVEFAVLMSVCMLVLVMELFNSAIEAIVDRMGEEPHALAGLAKDYGSAAVMVSMIIALIVWASLFFQRLQ